MLNTSLPPLLCRVCCHFYGNKLDDYLCSACSKDFRAYNLLSELCESKISLRKDQADSNQRMKGLLLYPFRGYLQSRLRKDHCLTLRVNQTRELRKDLLNPAYRKTLKYVKRFKDLRSESYDKDIRNPSHYYSSYQVIRQLKAVVSLNLLLAYTIMQESMLKNLFLLGSCLNSTNLTIRFAALTLNNNSRTTYYFDHLVLLIRKMKNLHYLGLTPFYLPLFGPNIENTLMKCRRTILHLPRLTEVSIGNSGGHQYLEVIHALLNHQQMRKIEKWISSITTEELSKVFKNLNNIKELDYIKISSSFDRFNRIEDQMILLDFLSSLKSINTLVLKNRFIDFSFKTEYLSPEKTLNITNMVIKGHAFLFLVKILQLTRALKSFEISNKGAGQAVLKDIGEALSNHIDLKELRIKVDFSHRTLTNLLESITLTRLKTFSLSFKKIESITDISYEQSNILEILHEFFKKQEELREVNLQLFLPVEFKELDCFLKKLSTLPKLTMIAIRLKIPKKFPGLDNGNKDEIRNYVCDSEISKHFTVSLDPYGSLVLQIKNPLL